jgi:DNA replication and repair protein RecF
VELVELKATGFRNLKAETLAWNRQTNLVVGANGQGKTNLLEAVAVLGNLRSFRTLTIARVVAHGDGGFLLEGLVDTTAGSIRLGQQVTTGPPVRRALSVAGAPAAMDEYLQVLPVFSLTGADRQLVIGPPESRRAFLDRCAFLLEPGYFRELRLFRRLLRQRNAALAAVVSSSEMETWESQLAQAASVVVVRRRDVVRRLVNSFESSYNELRGEDFPEVRIAYRGDPTEEQAEQGPEVEEYYRKRYNETRERDRRLGYTGEGPHRHDLGLRANERAVRDTLSSGQTKVVAASLRLASLRQAEEKRNERFPVIIDDIDAELDRTVLVRLVEYLDGKRQLFLSSANSEVLKGVTPSSSRLEIHRGEVIEVAGERFHE